MFLGDSLARLPPRVRVTLVQANSSFFTQGIIAALEIRGQRYILRAVLRAPVLTLCRHDDPTWTQTGVLCTELRDIM
jgi:hypothetical protein